MAKKSYLNDKKHEIVRKQRDKTTVIRKETIRSYFLSKCNPRGKSKDFFDAIRRFLSKKSKIRRTIMLKENENYVTDIKDLCKIFVICFLLLPFQPKVQTI